MPKFSIVIPSYLRSDKLRECIQSIIAYVDLTQTEVIVVANGAADETESICVASRQQRIAEMEEELARDPQDHETRHRLVSGLSVLRSFTTELPISLLWYPEPLGYPKAVNHGIRAAQGEFIVLLNDDACFLGQPYNECMEVMVQPMLKDGSVGVTGPLDQVDENTNRRFIIFFCVMIRRQCLDDVGLLDEGFLYFGEDCAFCIEAENKGWKVIRVPEEHPTQLIPLDPNTTTLEAWKHDKVHTGMFRIWHDAESTIGRLKDCDDVLRTSRARLRKLYGGEKVNTPTNNCSACGGEAWDGVCLGAENKPNCHGVYLWRAALIDGWFGLDEGMWLAQQVKALPKNAKVLEIGSWHGRSSRFIADNLPEGGQAWCCDTWIGSSGEPEMHGSAHQERGDHAFQWWFCNLQEHIEAGRVVPVRMHSDSAAATITHLVEKGQMPKFDLIFVDGDHSEEGIRTDVESWLPLLKDGGLMCGHDYYPAGQTFAWVHVREYVESKFPDVKQAATSIWWTYPKGERAPEPEPEHENLDYQRQSQYDFGANPEYADVVEKAHRALIEQWFHDTPRDTIILDAGCGNGESVRLLREYGFRNAVGIDLIGGPNVTEGDLHALPLPPNSIDIVYSVHSLEHAYDPIKVLSEFKRVLKPNGKLFLALPYPDYVDGEHRAKAHCGSPALGLLVNDVAGTLQGVVEEAGFGVQRMDLGSLRNEQEVYLTCQLKPAERGRIFDCFIFNNEFDLLEMRLETLYDVVDRFVLVEGTLTHSGQPKPLHFEENKERFAKYINKISHVVVDDYPEVPDLVGATELDNTANKAWTRERHQRDSIMHALRDCDDNDIILIGDADEIVNPEVLKTYDVSQGLCRLKQRLFYYYLNCENKVGWDWQKISSYKLVKGLTPCGVRYNPAGHLPIIEGAGWHFSFLSNVEGVIKKIRDYAHVEYATDEFLNPERLEKLITEGRDLYGRDQQYEFVEIDKTYPLYVWKHKAELLAKGFFGGMELVYPPPATVLDFKQSLGRKKHWTVTASVSTKDRYQTTLPLTLSAIINQTHKPDRLKIYDDGEQRDLREVSPFEGLLKLAGDKGIDWEIVHTPRLGQVSNHQHCLDNATTDFIWRVDDDEIPEPNCLQVLLDTVRDYGIGGDFDKIGAVGGLVHHPAQVSPLPPQVNGTLQDVAMGLNLQWFQWNGQVRETEHLYSTFMYSVPAAREAGGYPKDLSPVGHREETIFSHQLKRAGYKVLVTPYTKTYHLRESSGGIRSFNDNSMWESDERTFQRYLQVWNVKLDETKLIVIDAGLGDHLIAKGVWPDLKRKFPDKKWTLALCFPEVFKHEPDVTIISIADAKLLLGTRYDEFSVYRYCWDHNFERPMPEVMMEFFSK